MNKTEESFRSERVASRVQQELAQIVTRELSDPRLQNVLFTDVHVTADLSLAEVTVAVIGDQPQGVGAIAACRVLKRLEGGLRKRLAPRLGMRRVPSLKFRIHATRAESERFEALMHEVGQELRTKKED